MLSTTTIDILFDIACIIGGVVIIVKRKSISESIIRDKNKYFGTNYGEKVIRRGYIAHIIIGIGAIFLGMWGIINSIKRMVP